MLIDCLPDCDLCLIDYSRLTLFAPVACLDFTNLSISLKGANSISNKNITSVKLNTLCFSIDVGPYICNTYSCR